MQADQINDEENRDNFVYVLSKCDSLLGMVTEVCPKGSEKRANKPGSCLHTLYTFQTYFEQYILCTYFWHMYILHMYSVSAYFIHISNIFRTINTLHILWTYVHTSHVFSTFPVVLTLQVPSCLQDQRLFAVRLSTQSFKLDITLECYTLTKTLMARRVKTCPICANYHQVKDLYIQCIWLSDVILNLDLVAGEALVPRENDDLWDTPCFFFIKHMSQRDRPGLSGNVEMSVDRDFTYGSTRVVVLKFKFVKSVEMGGEVVLRTQTQVWSCCVHWNCIYFIYILYILKAFPYTYFLHTWLVKINILHTYLGHILRTYYIHILLQEEKTETPQEKAAATTVVDSRVDPSNLPPKSAVKYFIHILYILDL